MLWKVLILPLRMDASDVGVSALERVTFAPLLKKIGVNVPSDRFFYRTLDASRIINH